MAKKTILVCVIGVTLVRSMLTLVTKLLLAESTVCLLLNTTQRKLYTEN